MKHSEKDVVAKNVPVLVKAEGANVYIELDNGELTGWLELTPEMAFKLGAAIINAGYQARDAANAAKKE